MKTVNTAKLYTKQCFSASMDQLSTPALLHFGQTNQNQQNPAINRRDGVRVCFSVSGGRQRGQLDAIIRPVQSSNGNQTSIGHEPRSPKRKKMHRNEEFYVKRVEENAQIQVSCIHSTNRIEETQIIKKINILLKNDDNDDDTQTIN